MGKGSKGKAPVTKTTSDRPNRKASKRNPKTNSHGVTGRTKFGYTPEKLATKAAARGLSVGDYTRYLSRTND